MHTYGYIVCTCRYTDVNVCGYTIMYTCMYLLCVIANRSATGSAILGKMTSYFLFTKLQKAKPYEQKRLEQHEYYMLNYPSQETF